jgi:hypothetical protein
MYHSDLPCYIYECTVTVLNPSSAMFHCNCFAHYCQLTIWGRRGRDRMVVGFIITCVISAYHH